jgi:hypothetical protein
MRTLFRARVRKIWGVLHYLCTVTFVLCAGYARVRLLTPMRAHAHNRVHMHTHACTCTRFL